MVILVIDGYNIIGAWEELKRLKEISIGEARDRLIELMADYQSVSGQKVIIVFDAYHVPGIETRETTFDLQIIYTRENETADECIERLVPTLMNVDTKVYVATSDYTEQRIIFGKGALRKSARELYLDLQRTEEEIATNIERYEEKRQTKIPLKRDILEIFEKWRRGKS
ncbi:MAG TPA: NYN domain-containing protein [Bacillota bacterium]|nr:NYN domain-containing protein [Bacillota bacterium]